jgi:membrane protein DedA with SNARE-associated domain
METLQHSLQGVTGDLGAGIFNSLGYWKYVALAVLTIFEGPVATLLAAAASSIGLMNPVLVFLSAATGNMLGDSGWYLLGRLGKMEWIAGLMSRVGISPAYLERMERQIERNAPTFLFFTKLFNSLIIPALVTAGLARIPWRRWFPPLIGAEILWTGSLVLLGYYSAHALNQVEKGLPWVGLAAILAAVLFLLHTWWKSYSRRKSEGLLKNSTDSQ